MDSCFVNRENVAASLRLRYARRHRIGKRLLLNGGRGRDSKIRLDWDAKTKERVNVEICVNGTTVFQAL